MGMFFLGVGVGLGVTLGIELVLLVVFGRAEKKYKHDD